MVLCLCGGAGALRLLLLALALRVPSLLMPLVCLIPSPPRSHSVQQVVRSGNGVTTINSGSGSGGDGSLV